MLKSILKRTSAAMIVMIMVLTTFCFTDLGLTASAYLKDVAPTVSTYTHNATFYVPETIYLDPSDNMTGQYFYGVDSNGDVVGKDTAPSARTSALVYWHKDGATNVRIGAKVSSSEFDPNSTTSNLPGSYYLTDSAISTMKIGDDKKQAEASVISITCILIMAGRLPATLLTHPLRNLPWVRFTK